MKRPESTGDNSRFAVFNSRLFLIFELISVFAVLPALFGTRLLSPSLILVPLMLICVPAAIWLGKTGGFLRATFWSAYPRQERKYLPVLLTRLVVAAILLLLYAVLFLPESLFDLPRRAPGPFLLMLVGYMIFSVYPQELLFRAFFFRRYRTLFPNARAMAVANTIVFCWMHVAFANLTALWLSLIGGGLFATTYQKTRSLRLVCLEHALYGAMLFSIGYGRFFVYNPHWLRDML